VGLAAAIALQMRGAHVLVVDALKPPIDKACGEGLMPDARRDLAVLGVCCEPDEGAPFRGIQFVNWTDRGLASVSADFAGGEGIGMRRTMLHSRLVNRAVEVGVRLRWNTHVALGTSVSIDGQQCNYQYLVGADGQSSRVRKWAGLDRGRLISKRLGFRKHYRVRPFSGYVEVHWCALGQVYITPVGRDEICVAVVTRDRSSRMKQIIDSIPYLRSRLSSKDEISIERGALTTTRRLRCVAKSNIALIGDASGSVDAVTGEGLAVGFRQASLLGRSIEKGSLELYAADHEKSLQMARRMARALLLIDAHSSFRNAVMCTLASSPDLFRGLLQVHMGDETLAHFLLRNSGAVIKRLANRGVTVSETERAST